MTDIKILLAVLVTLFTQLWKMWKPESAATNAKIIATVIVVTGAVLNVIAFLAANDPIVVANTWDLVLRMVTVVIEGAALGAASVGFYEVGNGVISNVFMSTKELLARKYGVVTTTTINTKTAEVETLKAAGVEVSTSETEVGDTTTKKSTKKTPK